MIQRFMAMMLFTATILAGCHGLTPLQPYPNRDCKSACARLDELGCDEGDPSPIKGVPCETWCSQVHDDLDYLKPWAPCVSQAGDVGTVRACGVKCQ